MKCQYCKKPFELRSVKIKKETFTFPVKVCDCSEKIIKEDRSEFLLRDSKIDKYFLLNDFKVVHPKLKKYVKNFDWLKRGDSFFVYGNPGLWKTGQVTAIGKAVARAGYSVRYYRASDIYYQRDSRYIRRVDFLIIDNIARDPVENSRDAVFSIVDDRLHNFKSTAIVGNSGREPVVKIYGEAFADRLKKFEMIEIKGESKRGCTKTGHGKGVKKK